MADKYISATEDGLAEVEATVVGGTAGQAGDLVALDGTGRIDPSLLPADMDGAGYALEAGENLTAGDLVAVDNTGKAVRAVASVGGRPAWGYVTANHALGETATVYNSGINAFVTGLLPGRLYFLSDTTPGAASLTPADGPGELYQQVGLALSATALTFEPDAVIIRA